MASHARPDRNRPVSAGRSGLADRRHSGLSGHHHHAGAKLAIILITLTGLETHLLPRKLLKEIFRWYEPLKPWAMVDVYLLGFLVAYSRLAVIASVHLDTALYALIGLMLSVAAAMRFWIPKRCGARWMAGRRASALACLTPHPAPS